MIAAAQGQGITVGAGAGGGHGAPSSGIVPGKARPRGAYPHFRRAGELIFVSGTSSRRADDSIAGAGHDATGQPLLDIRVQTRAVLENIRHLLTYRRATVRHVL